MIKCTGRLSEFAQYRLCEVGVPLNMRRVICDCTDKIKEALCVHLADWAVQVFVQDKGVHCNGVNLNVSVQLADEGSQCVENVCTRHGWLNRHERTMTVEGLLDRVWVV